MKYKARTLSDQRIAVDCKPLLGELFTVYATFVDGDWLLPSGRFVPTPMLDAIDQLPDVSIRKRYSK